MRIAIVGATGLVGRKIIETLYKRNHLSAANLILYASEKSAGKRLKIGDRIYVVRGLNETSVKAVDVAIFSAGSAVALKYAPLFESLGAWVIDNSRAFRMNENVPLIIPEINAAILENFFTKNINTDPMQNSAAVKKPTKIIANPNCSTSGLALVLFYLEKVAPVKKVIVTTFQAASGAGVAGISDLENKTTNKFSEPLSDNLIPQIDDFDAFGNTLEENKIVNETQKILRHAINISATCVRVPVRNCHSESVHIQFTRAVKMEAIRAALNNAYGIKLLNGLSTPRVADGQNDVFVSRVRQHSDHEIDLFLCFDNLLKGAALNAVQIMETICDRNM